MVTTDYSPGELSNVPESAGGTGGEGGGGQARGAVWILLSTNPGPSPNRDREGATGERGWQWCSNRLERARGGRRQGVLACAERAWSTVPRPGAGLLRQSSTRPIARRDRERSCLAVTDRCRCWPAQGE